MSTWAPLMRKFDNSLLREQVADLQRNPYLLAEAETGEPEDHPKTRRAAKRYLKEYTRQCHANAFIFGDTYEGMPAEEAVKIIVDAGFSPSGRTEGGHIRFHHDYLAIGLTPRCNGKGELTCIAGNFILDVDHSCIAPESVCGLGMTDAEIVDDVLHANIDLTGGLKVKMFILKSWVAAHINEHSTPETSE